MPRIATSFLTAVFVCAVAASLRAETFETPAGPVTVTRMVADLDEPWAVAFLPDGGWLITERDGQLLRVDGETGAGTTVSGVPDVFASGQGGLLDVQLDPDFAANRTLYLSYSEPDGVFSARTAVARATLTIEGGALEDVTVLFRMTPSTSGGRHFGSRIVPDGKGHLWITLGDRGDADTAQDMDSHHGKVIRIGTDGSIPADNPFADSDLPEIWSIGHRNPQGAALDADGRLWTVAHGARGGDEINRPEAGRNYGWPVISYGRTYGGTKIGIGTEKDGMEQPVWYWDPSIAPSGLAICTGCAFPEWDGDLFAGSLKFDYVSHLERDGDTIVGETKLFDGAFGRIRDVRFGPDGALWFLSVADGALYRAAPAP